MIIAVATPTGHVGARVVQRLIAAKKDVVLLARKPESLSPELRDRAKKGNLEDAAFVKKATEGANCLFWLTPPNFAAQDLRGFMVGLANNAAAAIRRNKIARVVNLSSHGAGQPNLGPVEYLGEVEKVLDGAAPNVVHLRAGSFMENLLQQVPMLKQGLIVDAGNPEISMPYVATRDIADIATKWLLDPGWTGHKVVPVSGPSDLKLNDVLATLSNVLGKQIKHQRVGLDILRENLLKRGASPSVATSYGTMMVTFQTGEVQEEPRTSEATTPTTLEQFAREVLKPALDRA